MCDYSLHNVKTRPAQVGDKLTTRLFGWSTGGFAASEDKSVAVCLSPEPSCPLRKRSGKYDPGRGLRRQSVTRLRSSERLMRISRRLITMPWNFLMARLFC
jgi:hypothetical protein